MLVPFLAAAALAGELLVDVLDVGQGDAILVRGGGKAALIDAGPSGGGVLDQLRTLGIDRLDLLVATHPHADHIGGMAEVVRALDVGLFLDNGLPHTTRTYAALMEEVERRGIPYRTASSGMRLRMGEEAVFTVLFPAESPLTGTRSDLNSNSVVLWLDHGEVEMLLTGDAEAPTEARLEVEPVEVLKVAHHGSGHSSTTRFLERVRPTYALISCGSDNRYGHPAPETVERLREIGAMVYRTDLSGNLRVISDGTTVEVLEGTLDELQRARIGPVVTTRPAASLPTIAAAPTVPELSKREARRQERQRRREARRRGER